MILYSINPSVKKITSHATLEKVFKKLILTYLGMDLKDEAVLDTCLVFLQNNYNLT
jgi:hypothetical protein